MREFEVPFVYVPEEDELISCFAAAERVSINGPVVMAETSGITDSGSVANPQAVQAYVMVRGQHPGGRRRAAPGTRRYDPDRPVQAE